MLQAIINYSLRNRMQVLLAMVALGVCGLVSLRHLDIDAFPDTTPVQVQVNTTVMELTPEDIERLITTPVEQALNGLPGLVKLRSMTKFGLSQVVVTFEDGTDIYFARRLIDERLATVSLPPGISRPELGPVSTGLGEIFHYTVESTADLSLLSEAQREQRLTELRTVHDWIIKPELRSVPGHAEINSWGGYEKQFQVRIDPTQVFEHGLTFDEVIEALRKNNRNVGGGSISDNSQMQIVHGQGQLVNVEEIEAIVIRSNEGDPICIRDVAEVEIGHAIRRGAVTADGKGEAVLGLGFMLMGENSHDVTHAMKEKMEEIKTRLPAHIVVNTAYDRTELVDHVIETVRENLFLGGLLVVAILFLFLGSLRAGLIVASAIPLSMLFAFSGMLPIGIAASLLSLGAIDFGLVVDSSVVMVENCARHLSQSDGTKSKLEIVRDAAIEIRRPTLFGELIIMIVYLPILTLEGVEGKLFRPMALTVVLALVGSMLFSLTLMPVLASIMLPKTIEHREPLLIRILKWLYAPVLHFTMRYKLPVVLLAICVLVLAGIIAPNLGTEFIPKLSEGAISINVIRLAGTNLEESIRYNSEMERAILKNFPDEVDHVWSRIGTAEVATDPMGIELTDVFITLHPRNQWKRASTQTGLSREIEKLLREMPGQKLAFTQPIEMRLNEMTSGIKSDVAVKLFGDDFDQLIKTAEEIEKVLATVRGNSDVATEQITGQPVLSIRRKQDALARYGIPADDVLTLIESIGSKHVGEIIDGPMRFPLVVRLPDRLRSNAESIGRIELTTSEGERIPLNRLVDIEMVEGKSTIVREWGQRRITISANVRDRDIGSFVAEARKKIEEEITLPSGRYRMEWGGQFENMERAHARLVIVIPVALVLIFGLLYMTYHNVVDALRVFTSIPFACTGGIFALWLRDMPFSISAAIGFVALSGVAVLDDMLLVSTIRQLRNRGTPLEEAVEKAAMLRLRPILMTTLVASLGFLPMAFNTGMGAEVQRPLATVVIGGVISGTIMSLLVLRVLYTLFKAPFSKRSSPQDQAGEIE